MSVADFSAFLDAIGHAGPWVLLVAVCVGFLAVVVIGLRRKWWVIGWFFEDVEKRLAESIRANERLSERNDELVEIVTNALVRRDRSDNRHPGSERRGVRGQVSSDRDAPR
jgi:hypothetical protein